LTGETHWSVLVLVTRIGRTFCVAGELIFEALMMESSKPGCDEWQKQQRNLNDSKISTPDLLRSI